MRLDLADLKLLMCIAETGSITQGAIKAHLALSSASERLRGIEDNIGVPLFTRHTRGIVLTEAGHVLIKHAKKILKQHQQLQQELQAFSTGIRGHICLYANTSALSSFLPTTLAPWLQAHPDLHLELKEKSSVDIMTMLHSGQAEAGIVSNAVHTEGLILEPIINDHLVLIVPRAHALAQHTRLSLNEILHETFVGCDPKSALQQHIDTQAKARGKVLNIRIHVNHFDAVCEMVTKAVGIAIVPKVIAEKYYTQFSYHICLLEDAWAQRQLCLCYPQWDRLNPAMKNLLHYLRQQSNIQTQPIAE